jgi:hypothetical protein
MTPTKRLGRVPAKKVLVHEAGHLVIGLAFGIPEGGIRFIEGRSNEIARAEYNSNGLASRILIIRDLAGMYSQAIISPTSITENLRNRIVDCGLFAKGDFKQESDITKQMIENGFEGDWELLRTHASNATNSDSEALSYSRDACEELVRTFAGKKLDSIVIGMVEDIVEWFHEDDEDVAIAPWLYYSIGRARRIYEQRSAN